MKKDIVFNDWCKVAVPVIIDAMVAMCELDGGTFMHGVRTKLTLEGSDQEFMLLIPDQICNEAGDAPISMDAMNSWVDIVGGEIMNCWNKSFNGRKHTILLALNDFAVGAPNVAKMLLQCLKFEGGKFIFDVGQNQTWVIAKAKFDGWLESNGRTI